MGAYPLHKACLLALALAATASAASAAGDIKGSRDSPFLKRYEGSSIEHYEKKAFADFRFLLAPLPKRPDKEEVKTRTAEGPYTRLVYLAQTDDPALVTAARRGARRLGLTFDMRRTGFGDLATSVVAAADRRAATAPARSAPGAA